MDEKQLRLDGNAAAGVFRQIFVDDVTAAHAACGSCGEVAEIGSTPLYMNNYSPGAVLRCRACQDVLMVVVEVGGRWRLGTPALKWLEIDGTSQPR
jgi:hypothetical protein